MKQDDESYNIPSYLSSKGMMKEIEWKNTLPIRIGKTMEIVLMRNMLKAARTNITPILSINLQLQLIRIVNFIHE